MDDSGPFKHCSKVVLNCGNIASWNKMKTKVLLTSTQELSSSLENTLISVREATTPSASTGSSCLLRNSALHQSIKPEERENLQITLKVFISTWNGDDVCNAIQTSLAELGLSSVDTIILSFPSCLKEDLTLDKMKPVWQAMEVAAGEGKMKFLGTADLEMRNLKQLFEWATVKPRINQMNLAHCCTIPEDLKEYCKIVDIRLLTHNDERCILPVEELNKTVSTTLDTSSSWHSRWVCRYHAIVNLRGIVSHKGYIMELQKNGI